MSCEKWQGLEVLMQKIWTSWGGWAPPEVLCVWFCVSSLDETSASEIWTQANFVTILHFWKDLFGLLVLLLPFGGAPVFPEVAGDGKILIPGDGFKKSSEQSHFLFLGYFY